MLGLGLTLMIASPLLFWTITLPLIPKEELVDSGSRTPVLV